MGMTLPFPIHADTQERPKLPRPSYGDPKIADEKGEHVKKLRAWQNDRIQYTHPYRIRQCSNWRKADLYDMDIQWLIKSYNNDPTRTQHWAPMEFDDSDPDAIPLPTYNEFSGPIENETARLGRPEYKPYVRPSGESPDIKVRTAAKLSEKTLQQALQDMRWNETEDMGELHMPLYGGWYLKSYWDASWEKTTRIPVKGAMKCPACDFRMASPEIPYDRAVGSGPTDIRPDAPVVEGLHLAMPDRIQREEPPDPLAPGAMPKFTTGVCLTCQDHEEMGMVEEPAMGPMGEALLDEMGQPAMRQAFGPKRVPGPPKLQPFTPVDDELGAKDYLDRPLGEDVPLGEWKLRTLMPYDVFVENLGINVRINEMQEWTEVHVESLEWICNRYENGHKVKAENPTALMEYHQVAGERALYAGTHAGAGLFENHCRVKESHKKPWREEVLDADGKGTGKYELNRGRTIVMAGDVLLFDGDYLMESQVNPGVYIPRVHLDYVPWKLRSGGNEHSGISMSEGLFDPQDNINEVKSQFQDTRQTMGSPKFQIPRGANFDYERSGAAGSHWIYDWVDGQPEPKVIGNELLSSEAYRELESDIEFMGRHANLNEVEGGDAPAGITAGLALQILAEQSGERRRPRIRRIREMLMRCYSHGLQLMHELVREPRKYWEKDDRNGWSEKSWTGADLIGQTDCQIDVEPEHNTSVQEQQTIQDVIKLGGIDLTNRRTRRLAAKKMGVPAELYEDDDLQEEAAEREFIGLLDENVPPVVDLDLNDHEAHFQRHGIDMHGEKWRELEKEADWATAYLFLCGWEEGFDEQPGEPIPVGMDPKTGQEITQPGMPVPGRREMIRQAMPAIKAEELVILEDWKQTLTQAQQMGAYQPRPGSEKALKKVMRLRAHAAYHKRLMKAESQAQQAGAPVVAAPESPQAPL